MRSIIVAASLCVVLTGCNTVPKAPATLTLPPLEDLDKRLTEPPCGTGAAKLGDDVVIAGDRKSVAIDCWTLHHLAWVRFYQSLYMQSELLRAGRAPL